MPYGGLPLNSLAPPRRRQQALPYGSVAPPMPQAPPEGSVIGGGGNLPPLPGGQLPQFGGIPKKPKKAQKWLQQMHLYNALQAQQMLYPQIEQLQEQANTDRFSPDERSAFLSPRLEALDTGFDLQRGALDQNLASRGLDSSSEAVSRFANLGGREAEAGARLRNDLFQSEEQRQLAAQADLRSLLTALMGGGAQGASGIANQRIQNQLQQQQMEGGSWLDSLLGLGGAALGGWAGGGFGGLGGGKRGLSDEELFLLLGY